MWRLHVIVLAIIMFASCARERQLGKYIVMCEGTDEVSRYNSVISITIMRDRFAVLYSTGKGVNYVEKIDYFLSDKCWFSENDERFN